MQCTKGWQISYEELFTKNFGTTPSTVMMGPQEIEQDDTLKSVTLHQPKFEENRNLLLQSSGSCESFFGVIQRHERSGTSKMFCAIIKKRIGDAAKPCSFRLSRPTEARGRLKLGWRTDQKLFWSLAIRRSRIPTRRRRRGRTLPAFAPNRL